MKFQKGSEVLQMVKEHEIKLYYEGVLQQNWWLEVWYDILFFSKNNA